MIHEYDPASDTGADVPIGRAAPGCEVRILDDTGRRAPIGSWGELYVAATGWPRATCTSPSSRRNASSISTATVAAGTGPATGSASSGPACPTYGGRIDDQLKVERRPAGAQRGRGRARHPPGRRHGTRPGVVTRDADPPARSSDAFAAASAPTCPASRSASTACAARATPTTRSSRRPGRGSRPRPISTGDSSTYGPGTAARSTASTCCRAARTRRMRSTSSSNAAGESTR